RHLTPPSATGPAAPRSRPVPGPPTPRSRRGRPPAPRARRRRAPGGRRTIGKPRARRRAPRGRSSGWWWTSRLPSQEVAVEQVVGGFEARLAQERVDLLHEPAAELLVAGALDAPGDVAPLPGGVGAPEHVERHRVPLLQVALGRLEPAPLLDRLPEVGVAQGGVADLVPGHLQR